MHYTQGFVKLTGKSDSDNQKCRRAYFRPSEIVSSLQLSIYILLYVSVKVLPKNRPNSKGRKNLNPLESLLGGEGLSVMCRNRRREAVAINVN